MSKDQTSSEAELRIIAHHEAAHAVVSYRVCGHAGGVVTIVPDRAKGNLGEAHDAYSDSFNAEHMEARILSCYAGGHAQRRIDPSCGDAGCDGDDEIAADLLAQFGWVERETEFRLRSLELVGQYWGEIVAVAEVLSRTNTLDDAEVEIIADTITGDTTVDDLQRYRLLKKGGA